MSVVSYNNSGGSGAYSSLSACGLPRSTVLLSRPAVHCRCDVCTIVVRQGLESSICGSYEPLMIPTLSTGYGWWNVRLPSKLLEPVVEFKNAEFICVDDDVMSFFEEKKVINWCPGLRQLHPIRTTGDGNCLMHAVILATSGIQDSGLVLRRLVYVALVEASSNTFRARWQKEKQRLNENIPGGLQYTTEEWDKEWNIVVNAAEDLRKATMAYEFLEEMHVFVLANVICRPIIILGESTVRSPLAGDSIEQNNFVGVYLPLLWHPNSCDPNPVVLCFLHNHFQPLISRYKFPSEPKDLLAIPLVTSRLEPLHIHFLLPDEEASVHDLLQQYLYTSEVPRKSEDGSSDEAILVAEVYYSNRYYNWEYDDYLYLTEDFHAQLDAQKIAQVPSKSSVNYIQPAKRDCPVHRASRDVDHPKHLVLQCCRCREMSQKSTVGQLGSSTGERDSLVEHRESSKGRIDRSKVYPDELKDYPDHFMIHPDCPKIHPDSPKVHPDRSVGGNLDSANRNTRRHCLGESHMAKNLPVLGKERQLGVPEPENVPENVMIFKTLKKLFSTQQEESSTWRESHPVDESKSSGTLEKGRQHVQGAVGREPGSIFHTYNVQSQNKMWLPPGGSKTRTVRAQGPVTSSEKPGNSRSPAKEKRSHPQRRLSDISEADVEYIRQKFTLKTPIYCRSLSLLGKQCSKPDCKRFVVKETHFCCPLHSSPRSPVNAVAKPKTLCTRTGCMKVAGYGGLCYNCYLLNAYEARSVDEKQSEPNAVRSRSDPVTKLVATHQEPRKAPFSVMEPKVKCITDGCKGHGYPDYLGLCVKCFVQAYLEAYPLPKGPATKEKVDSDVAVELLNRAKCVTEGCQSLGDTGYMGLCAKCYVQEAYFALYPARESPAHQGNAETKHGVTTLNQVPCITEDCKGLGHSTYLGLCPKCYIQAYFEACPAEGSSEYPWNPDTEGAVEPKTESQPDDAASLYGQVFYLCRILNEKSGPMDSEQEKFLLIPSPSHERDKRSASRETKVPYGEPLPQKSAAEEEVERGRFQVSEKPALKAIEDNFNDWFDKKYPPKVHGSPTEPPVLEKLPVRSENLPGSGEELERKARNVTFENKESFQSEEDDGGNSGCQRNILEHSFGEEKKVEASQEDVIDDDDDDNDDDDDVLSLVTEKTSQPNLGCQNYGELSLDDVKQVDLALLRSTQPIEDLWKLHSSAPELVAAGDESSSIREELPKCLSTLCNGVTTNIVAGGYCATCSAARLLGNVDVKTGGLVEGVAKHIVKTQETVVLCVTEGCRNSVALVEFGLCLACYARQLKASTCHTDRTVLLSPQISASSAVREETKAQETSRTSSELPRKAKLCLGASCDRYGDPAFSGYCSQCATHFENSPFEIDSC